MYTKGFLHSPATTLHVVLSSNLVKNDALMRAHPQSFFFL